MEKLKSKLYSNTQMQDLSVVSLSRKPKQRCWKEDIPKVDVSVLLDRRRTLFCDGYLSRKGELIDYLLYVRTGILWLRYHGDARFYQGWSSCTFRSVHKNQYVLCPFCWSSGNSVYIWSQGLRCVACLNVESRRRKEQLQTIEERSAIQNGNLDDIAKKLSSGTLSQRYRAIIAMEMTGLTERKYTIGGDRAAWKIKRSPRSYHQII